MIGATSHQVSSRSPPPPSVFVPSVPPPPSPQLVATIQAPSSPRGRKPLRITARYRRRRSAAPASDGVGRNDRPTSCAFIAITKPVRAAVLGYPAGRFRTLRLGSG